MEALELNKSRECLECEVAICSKDCELLEKGTGIFICPQCRSEDGFKKKLSIHHREKIEKLEFICPNISCNIKLLYNDAL